MSDKKEGGGGGHGPNITVIAICAAVIAVAAIFWPRGSSQAPEYPSFTTAPSAPQYGRTSNQDNVPSGFYVIKR